MMLATSYVPEQHRGYFPHHHHHHHQYYYTQLRNSPMSLQQQPPLVQPSFHSPNSPTASGSHVHHHHHHHSNPASNSHRLPLPEPELSPYMECPNHSVDGFPTQQQFEDLLNEYILSLSPKKRDKALIPQKRYDNILAVLKDPRCTTIESAQFRFWAKKMFRLNHDESSDVVCHEGKPVAVREQLYEVLTESHGRAQHGGRDKTSAEVRKFYSWVPKELIARFVRNCPSCTLRRSSPLEYPMTTMHPKAPQGYNVMVGSTTYAGSTSASALSPILRTSNDAMSSMTGNTLTMTSPTIPQLQAIPNGNQLLPPGGQDVPVGSYQYSTDFPTTLAEATGSLSAVSPLLDPRSATYGARP